MAKPPKLKIDDHAPLQDYFNDGTGAWFSVAKLVESAKDLPIFDCPLASLDLSGKIWHGSNMLALAAHCKRVDEADTDMPILLDWDGGIADGRHRVIKALIDGGRTIKARRLMVRPEPCRRGLECGN